MRYNFDEIIDRRNSDSIKWGQLEELYGDEDVLPLWIADMDFRSADEIVEAIKERADHGVFGYIYMKDSFYQSIIDWVKRRFNWEIKKEWILFTPGVVMGFNIGVRELVDKGDKVLVQPPVYPPFYRVLDNNGRVPLENPLKHDGERYVMDFEDLEEKAADSSLIMLCNPHNPVGRVWTREELDRLGQICVENDITIISDEIHCDFTLKGVEHTPMASLSKELEQQTITLMAPSKTFNIAGLTTSVAIIPNEELREKYTKALEVMEVGNPTIFGALALETAYKHGEEWLDEVMVYVEDNIDYAIQYIKENIPEIKVDRPDGTYLLWLDFRSLNKSNDEIEKALIEEGKVALNDGRPYGTGGDGFFRLNIGCPRSILKDGLQRIEKAVKGMK
ncbi:MAG TPA: MalY/PatB family protein [Tissierellaceae bacterium]|nr:MalY/PatB family protein [Tissierellaceae bacterium]